MSQKQHSTKPKKSKPKHRPNKPRCIDVSGQAQTSSPAEQGKRWSLGASWDGFGVKAGLKLDSRNAPNARSTTKGPVFVHEEVIATLKSPPALSSSISVAHVFQPGMHTQFPWLANTAGGFQQYRVRRACYRYEPFSSVFAAGGVQGRVSMFFDYSVSTPLDENIDDMLNKAPSLNVQSAVGATLTLNPKFMIDNTRKTKNLRLDDQSISTNYDAYDAGRLVIGLDQFTAAVEFGKIVVAYEVEFVIPAAQKIPSAVGKSAMLDAFIIEMGQYGPASGVSQAIRSAWVGDSANAGNVELLGDSGTNTQYFQMEEGFYLVLFDFTVQYDVANNIQGSYFNYIVDGSLGQQVWTNYVAATGTAYLQSLTASGSGPIGVHGGGGTFWPAGAVTYTAWTAPKFVTARLCFVLLA